MTISDIGKTIKKDLNDYEVKVKRVSFTKPILKNEAYCVGKITLVLDDINRVTVHEIKELLDDCLIKLNVIYRKLLISVYYDK